MKHWVFDLDGTLIDSHGVYVRTLEDTFARYDVAIQSVDMKLSRKLFARDFLSHYIPGQYLDEAFKHLIDYNLKLTPEIPVFDGIHELLQTIQQKDVMISLWTAREKITADEVLKNTGLSKFLRQHVTACCVSQNKPHPEGLLKILTDSKSHHNDVVMIGDSDFDIQGAKAANVKSVSVSWGNPESAKLAEISDHHFHTVSEMKAWAQLF